MAYNAPSGPGIDGTGVTAFFPKFTALEKIINTEVINKLAAC